MNSYKTKYFKYKKKYLLLKTKYKNENYESEIKSQFGGVTLEDLKKKITYTNVHCISEDNYFHQHKGECWSDAIQMLICFSDEIKLSVQSKLYNLTPDEIIKMAYLQERNVFLPSIYKMHAVDENLQDNPLKKFEKRLTKYLSLLQNRLCLHIVNSNMDSEYNTDDTDNKIINQCEKININSYSCPIIENFSKFLLSEKIEPNLRLDIENPESWSKQKLYRAKSEILGIGSAIYGLKIANIKKKLDDHGALEYEILPVINALSYCLLDEEDVLQTKYVKISEITKDLGVDFDKFSIDNYLGAIVLNPSHATSFFICNGRQIYFDDNYGVFFLNWKKLLIDYLCYMKTHHLFLYHNIDNYIPIYQDKVSLKIYEMKDGFLINFDVDYNDLKKYFIEGFIMISKVNLKDANEDLIYSTLEDQFVVSNLLNGSIYDIKNPFSKFSCLTPINYVATNLNIELFKEIINSISDFNSDLNLDKKVQIKKILFNCLNDRRFDVIEYLVPKYFSIDVVNKNGETLLMKIIDTRAKHYDMNIECNELKIMNYLIKLQKDEHFKINNYTIFEYALIKRNVNAINIFIKNKYNFNLPNYKNETPFIFLSERTDMNKEDIKIIKILINAGVDVNQRDNKGYTILEYLLSKNTQTELEKEIIKIIELRVFTLKTEETIHSSNSLQKKYIDLIIGFNYDDSKKNIFTKAQIIKLFNEIKDFNIGNIDISNEMRKIFFYFDIMLFELDEQTIINILPYLHKNNFCEYCPLITEKYKSIIDKILLKYNDFSIVSSNVLVNIISNFHIDYELLFELFSKLNTNQSYLAFVSRMCKDPNFLEKAVDDKYFVNKEKIIYFFKKVNNTNLKIYSFNSDTIKKLIDIIIKDYISNKKLKLIEECAQREQTKKLSDTVNKQIIKKDNLQKCLYKMRKNINLCAKKYKIFDTDINKILINLNIKIQEIKESIIKTIPKTIEIEQNIIYQNYKIINEFKTNIKRKIITESESITLSLNDFQIMGNKLDPLIIIGDISLTGTYFYINNKNMSIYSLDRIENSFNTSRYGIEDELISKIKNVINEPYEKIINVMEKQLEKISLVKKNEKYIINDMYVKFKDKKKNLFIYNLINEAKNKKLLSKDEEEFNRTQIKNFNLYVPPDFLAIDVKKKKFLLSDLINFFGERPYIIFNSEHKKR